MTLPASGAISLNDINVELGLAGTTQVGMNDAAVRELFGIAAGAIDMNTGHGRTRQVLVAGAQDDTLHTFIGYSSTSPFGSLTPRTIGAYSVDFMYERKLDATGAFELFIVWMAGNNVPQDIFSTLTINGQTYSSVSATYNGTDIGIRTSWMWSTPDPSLVNTTSYNAIFAP